MASVERRVSNKSKKKKKGMVYSGHTAVWV
jgi:hypothetical protein